MAVYEKRKSELVKIELHVPRATYGNYEKLRQALDKKDVPTMILSIVQHKIRQTLGSHSVYIPKDTYATLEVKARKKKVEINELATEIVKAKLEEVEGK